MKRLVAVLALLIVLPVQAEVIRRGLTLGVADGRYVNVSGDTMTGTLGIPVTTGTTAGLFIAGDALTGIRGNGSGGFFFITAGAYAAYLFNSNIGLHSSGSVRWTSSATDPSVGPDVGLARGGVGVLRVTNGTTGGGALNLLPIAAPSNPASGAVLYIDSADNDLKIKYSDGVVVVVGNKP